MLKRIMLLVMKPLAFFLDLKEKTILRATCREGKDAVEATHWWKQVIQHAVGGTIEGLPLQIEADVANMVLARFVKGARPDISFYNHFDLLLRLIKHFSRSARKDQDPKEDLAAELSITLLEVFDDHTTTRAGRNRFARVCRNLISALQKNRINRGVDKDLAIGGLVGVTASLEHRFVFCADTGRIHARGL